MIGELTEKARTYENIAKNNNIDLNQNVKNFITDILTMEEQKVEEEKLSEEQERILELMRDKSLFKEYIKEKYGSFYFSYYNNILDKLKPQYLTRALYLSSFMNYKNLLVEGTTRPIPIYEEDLQRILRLSRAEMFNTKKELLAIDFLIINDDKTLSINEKFCKKGEIMKSNKNQKARIFNDAIKELYENAKPSEHKKLALLFKLLPYINLRWNIVCSNTDEEIKEMVVPLTIKTLAEILGQSNVTRLKKDLLSLTVNGKPVVIITSVLDKNAILINPSIYYKGTRLEDVEHIEQLIESTLSAV